MNDVKLAIVADAPVLARMRRDFEKAEISARAALGMSEPFAKLNAQLDDLEAIDPEDAARKPFPMRGRLSR